MSNLNSYINPTPPIGTPANMNVAYITNYPTGTNIFLAYLMAQGSVPGSAILINTPYYVAPDTPKGASMTPITDILKPAPALTNAVIVGVPTNTMHQLQGFHL